MKCKGKKHFNHFPTLELLISQAEFSHDIGYFRVS